MNTIISNQMECAWCHKVHETPRELLLYDEKIFCDDQCLGEYLVDRADGDIDVIWFDTPDNMDARAQEERSQW